jgi:NADPH-dependent 2,4-dienoyl-CoA reductase/sulfur reductase-like enzyme
MSGGALVIGGGLAAQRCVETLRARGWDGPLRMVAAEPWAPYDRPPLSKAALRADTAHAALALRPDGWHAAHGVDLLAGCRAVALDPAQRTVTLDDDGARLRDTHIVVATGSRPRTLALLDPFENVFTLRTLADARALAAVLAPGARLAVVGAGFLGLEVAATARRRGVAVTLVEAGPAPAAAVLGPQMGSWLADLHRREGAAVHVATSVTSVHGRGRAEALALSTGAHVACDAVLVAIGTVPDTAWAGFPDGVPVDRTGRAGRPGLWAAGDAARPWDADARAHIRTEHWEAAARQGGAVAHAIAGLPVAAPPPAFWTDQYGIRMQFAGTAAGHDALAIEGDFDCADARILYLRRGRPVGGLLVGRPRALPDLRRLLARGARPKVAAA